MILSRVIFDSLSLPQLPAAASDTSMVAWSLVQEGVVIGQEVGS